MKKAIILCSVIVILSSFSITASCAPPECPNLNPVCPGFLDIYIGCSGSTVSVDANNECYETDFCTYDILYSSNRTGCDLFCGYISTTVDPPHQCKEVHDGFCEEGTKHFHQ